MSDFAGETPVLRVVLENPFFRRRYPEEGSAVAVVDTGYEGFAAVPLHVFEALSLDGASSTGRTVRTADGRQVESRLALSSLTLPELRATLTGTSRLWPACRRSSSAPPSSRGPAWSWTTASAPRRCAPASEAEHRMARDPWGNRLTGSDEGEGGLVGFAISVLGSANFESLFENFLLTLDCRITP